MKRLFAAMTAALMMVALVSSVVTASRLFTHATGGIAMSPSQYASFSAFDYGASGDRGTFNYTNFAYAAVGTGVWNIVGTYPLVVTFAGIDYTHSMTVDTVTPTSTKATAFSGTGFYPAVHTWTVTGSVTGSDLSFDLLYINGPLTGYTFHAIGTIAADGSMSGTATDSLFETPLTWSTPAGSAHEVLSYTASVTCADVSSSASTATFGFTIPAGFPGLSGLNIVAKVYDGGTPGTNGDTWAHGVANDPCEGPASGYPITSGNLVVH